ncbi:DUF1501 domain-containing protein [Prosthecobacter sp.]|jgi:hypothetical protein|uniref:DUF1501 domain-containing protein n=1 Tax=Prosthecobacter sp. TaxID=1965333 RepID=UPI003784F99B
MKTTSFCLNRTAAMTRRDALRSLSAGFGYLAFQSLAAAATSPLASKQPHFAPKAKRVIFLCMRGGPSHLDTFDYKPRLIADAGKSSRYAGSQLMPSLWEFKQRGQSGLWISEAFPNVAKHADDLCLLRGMTCDQPSHAQAFVQMHTGVSQFVRPSLGAWALYGLGTENQNLPGYITINPPSANGGAQNYGSAFLPAAYQGTKFQISDSSQRSRAIDIKRRGEVNNDGLNHLRNEHLTTQKQRGQIDFINALNREKLARDTHAPLIEGAIESYELAFRMQDAVPGVMDLTGESPQTLALYGINEDPTDGFGRQCLLARRFVEAGVRFIELGHGSWDQHANIQTALGQNCAQTDKPIAGLLADLKQRDLLKDTLVIWGGEFGRTSYSPDGNGRDHNHKGYTIWMAGGGVKGGFSHGETDEHGYEAVTGKVHIHDWHATVLHLLGFDHEKLTYRFGGRNMRLTDLYGNVVREIVA